MTETPEPSLPDPPPSRSGRQALLWAVKILVSGGLLYVLLRRVDLWRLWQTARTASFGWLAVALLLYLLVILIGSWRWWVLPHPPHIPAALRVLGRSLPGAPLFH